MVSWLLVAGCLVSWVSIDRWCFFTVVVFCLAGFVCLLHMSYISLLLLLLLLLLFYMVGWTVDTMACWLLFLDARFDGSCFTWLVCCFVLCFVGFF